MLLFQSFSMWHHLPGQRCSLCWASAGFDALLQHGVRTNGLPPRAAEGRKTSKATPEMLTCFTFFTRACHTWHVPQEYCKIISAKPRCAEILRQLNLHNRELSIKVLFSDASGGSDEHGSNMSRHCKTSHGSKGNFLQMSWKAFKPSWDYWGCCARLE